MRLSETISELIYSVSSFEKTELYLLGTYTVMLYGSSLMLSKKLGPYFVATRSALMKGYFALLHRVDLIA
jgi:hypothetical protein